MPDFKRWSRDEISRMRRDLDRLFDDFCADFDLPVMLCRMTGDLCLAEEKGMLVARMELHALNPDTVRVSARNRSLVIHARSEVTRDGRCEARSFSREIRLPCRVDPEGMTVRFVDGILEIRLPKCRNASGQLATLFKR